MVGSIPACAGEPHPQHPDVGAEGVYPRVCGGTSSWWGSMPTALGLSPRVRGNRRQRGGDGGVHRSIPACAGEPGEESPRHGCGGVYPRVCGGTLLVALPAVRAAGLSPRVRGNPLIDYLGAGRLGSIPACAGEPICGGRSGCPSGVYPRVCGGTDSDQHRQNLMYGLSPRVRGNPQPSRWMGDGRGSIPACAGEPPLASPPEARRRVYPRVCGGTLQRSGPGRQCRGLSPRVRGNRRHPRVQG